MIAQSHACSAWFGVMHGMASACSHAARHWGCHGCRTTASCASDPESDLESIRGACQFAISMEVSVNKECNRMWHMGMPNIAYHDFHIRADSTLNSLSGHGGFLGYAMTSYIPNGGHGGSCW